MSVHIRSTYKTILRRRPAVSCFERGSLTRKQNSICANATQYSRSIVFWQGERRLICHSVPHIYPFQLPQAVNDVNSGQVRASEKLYQLKALQDIDRIDEVCIESIIKLCFKQVILVSAHGSRAAGLF